MARQRAGSHCYSTGIGIHTDCIRVHKWKVGGELDHRGQSILMDKSILILATAAVASSIWIKNN